jgi:hypothetical protein
LALEQCEISYSWERCRPGGELMRNSTWERRCLAGELMSYVFETRRRDASAPRPAEIRDRHKILLPRQNTWSRFTPMTPCGSSNAILCNTAD